MRKWFLNLPLGKKKGFYFISIFVSIVAFAIMVNFPLFYPVWALTLITVIIEQRTIKNEKLKNENPSPEVVNKEPEPVVSSVVVKAEPQKAETAEPAANFTVNIKTEWVDRPPVGVLSHLDFEKPEGTLGCFLNYKPDVLYQPTEKQLNYLKDLGVYIPEGITKTDASYMIGRALEEDSRESPSHSIVALADGFGLKYSAFIGAEGLFRSIIYSAKDRDRAALYAYAVSQNIRGIPFGNMLEDPKLEKYYSIAENIVSDPALLRSLLDRPSDDYKKPHHGTAVYKAVASQLIEE